MLEPTLSFDGVLLTGSLDWVLPSPRSNFEASNLEVEALFKDSAVPSFFGNSDGLSLNLEANFEVDSERRGLVDFLSADGRRLLGSFFSGFGELTESVDFSLSEHSTLAGFSNFKDFP